MENNKTYVSLKDIQEVGLYRKRKANTMFIYETEILEDNKEYFIYKTKFIYEYTDKEEIPVFFISKTEKFDIDDNFSLIGKGILKRYTTDEEEENAIPSCLIPIFYVHRKKSYEEREDFYNTDEFEVFGFFKHHQNPLTKYFPLKKETNE